MSIGQLMGVVRVLNVAEKPSVAKEITAILSKGKSAWRSGFSKYNGIFEFQYMLNNREVTMMVTSVTGHLMQMDVEQRYRSFRSCDPIELFDEAKVSVVKFVTEEHKGIERTLKCEAERSHEIILWLDCDREGENIAFEVLDVCKRANPRLRVWRAKFSSLIPAEIHAACRSLGPPNIADSNAVEARREIDLRIGAAFTRYQTLRI